MKINMAARYILTLILLHLAGANIFTVLPFKTIPSLPPSPQVRMPTLPEEETLALLSRATQGIQDRISGFEPSIVNKGVILTPGTPPWQVFYDSIFFVKL